MTPKNIKYFFVLIFLASLLYCTKKNTSDGHLFPTPDNGSRLLLSREDLKYGPHHLHHFQIFSKYVQGYNRYILKGIDKVQSTALGGGGYFIGIDSIPTESPVGYPLSLLGVKLLEPPRSTSYCSGSSYAAFIEGLNFILSEEKNHHLNNAQAEALRMQETDGSRREDHIKFWGKWNADGYGNYFALVNYAKMGKRIKPVQARPGDFMNISWKKGGGHSVIFLGWFQDDNNKKYVVYWSSQKRTNGFGDELIPIERIKEVMVVRLTQPNRIFFFDTTDTKDVQIQGDAIAW